MEVSAQPQTSAAICPERKRFPLELDTGWVSGDLDMKEKRRLSNPAGN